MPDIRIVSAWVKRENGDRTWAVLDDYPDTPDGWSDATGQAPEDIDAGQDTVVLFGKVSDAQLTALITDSRYVVIANPESTTALSAPQKDALQAELETIYHADVAKLIADDADTPAEVVEVLKTVNTRPPWKAGLKVTVGQVYLYERNLWEVIQAHTTQADWTPNRAFSLFRKWRDSGKVEPWEQPLSTNPYPLGHKVTHKGKTWESLIANNVWEPGAVGSEALWKNLTPPPVTSEWRAGSGIYSVGDLVTWKGFTYRCRQNPGINIWEPQTVPALWGLVP